MFCTNSRNELLETWNGFRKTRTLPHIYYKAAEDRDGEIELEEFNKSWRDQFLSACKAARSGRRPVAVRFKTIPAFEGKVNPRIEPTALAGYEIHKRNHKGDAIPRHLLHVKFYYQERQAKKDKIPRPQLHPRTDWQECPRIQFSPGKWAKLHTRFRTPGAGTKLIDDYHRDYPDGFQVHFTNPEAKNDEGTAAVEMDAEE